MEQAPFRFVGNIEGRDVTGDLCDVVVADGFSGNLILKFMEGVAGTLMDMIKKEIYADFRSKLGGLLAKPAFNRVKKAMDYTEVGGAPLLGVKGVVVKAHGSSNAHAIACAAGNMVPVPGLGISADLVAMSSMCMCLAGVFGGNIPEEVAKGMAVAAIKRTLLKHPVKVLPRKLAKYIPVVGQIVSGTLSIIMIEAAGWTMAKELEQKAKSVKQA